LAKYDLVDQILWYGARMRNAAPVMNDPSGELSRLSVDERCRRR
jgi:hypothetical protein